MGKTTLRVLLRRLRYKIPQPFLWWLHQAEDWINRRLTKPEQWQLDQIANADRETLLAWNATLNSWGWPKELSPPAEDARYRPGGLRSQLTERIIAIVGEKAANRYHNRDSMTDEAHEFFWTHPYQEYWEKYEKHKYPEVNT